MTLADDPTLGRLVTAIFDPAFYARHYPDVAAAKLDPLAHFLHHGLQERRDPNAFFDSAWYAEHYPDVGLSGIVPLLHYLQAGAGERRNPHPGFDAAWYVDRHPDAAANPLLYHIEHGAALGWPTERQIDIADYLPAPPPPTPKRRRRTRPDLPTVDVIIPVYKGLEETRRCLDSVIANTAAPLGRIIVVEDKSPEPDLVAWLARLARAGRIHLVRNETNQGFVRSVNTGMTEAGDNDVVLLNSDTEVPPGWLARLTAQAGADPRIASVSPLSNNATICSWPDNDGGPIPFGLDVAAMDAACQAANAGRSVAVPTTVGFCMYIRRAALNQVGLFDAKRFRLGYGEENDFCLRASALGWTHRLACDTFVYHKGSVSFQERAIKLAKRAARLIEERFPSYPRDIAAHVALGAADPARFALTAALFRRLGRPVILMVSHELGGGIQRHVADLTARLADRAGVLLLRTTDRGAELSVPGLPGHPRLALPAERLDDLVALLRTMAVTRVHIHHLMGMDIDVQRLIHRLGVPFDVTVHDYFAICPQMNLLPWRHAVYCGEPGIAACNLCIARRSSHAARDIVTWRAQHAWLFHDAARVLCPSRDVLDRLRRFGLADKAILAPHEPPAASRVVQRRAPRPGERLRVAVIGTLVDHKGGRSVAAVAELAGGRGIDLHLIGHIDGDFPPSARRRLTVTGRYEEAELPALLARVAPHLVWFPMTWPETYSYTLSAALQAGLPVAATDIGALPERLTGRPLTWIAPLDTTPDGWVTLFQTIAATLRTAATAPDAGPDTPAPDAGPDTPAPDAGDTPAPINGDTSAPINGDTSARQFDAPSAPGMPDGIATAGPGDAAEDYYARAYLADAAVAAPAVLSGRRPRIVIVPERFDIGVPTPCAYIRLIQPLSHPAIAADCEVTLADAETIFDLAPDLIVTQRYAIPDLATADRLAVHARAVGARLVYDLDDDLLNIPRNHPDAAALRPLARVVRQMLALADTVWVSTAGLAASIARLRPDARLIENRLDERIWAYAPAAPPPRQTPVRILAMGTTTHDHDFALILPALTRLKREYQDRVEIGVLGMTGRSDLPAGLVRIGPPGSALRSYPGFVQWLTGAVPGWQIGLAPLLDTAFNACKSAIKTMDYAALGLAVLASDTAVYRGSLADGVAGMLVGNTDKAWYAALDRLMRDAPARAALMRAARPAFLARASLAGQAADRRAALQAALQAPLEHEPDLRQTAPGMARTAPRDIASAESRQAARTPARAASQ